MNIINNQLTSTSQDSSYSDSIQLAPIPATNQTISSSSNAKPMITTGPPTVKNNQWLASVFYINSRSIVNKLDKFQSVVYSNSYDIIAVSETWLTNDIYSNEILPSN